MTLTNLSYSSMITEGYSYKIGKVVLNGNVEIPASALEFSYPSPQEVQLVFQVPDEVTDVSTLAIQDYSGKVLSLNNLYTTVVPNTFFKYRLKLDQGV